MWWQGRWGTQKALSLGITGAALGVCLFLLAATLQAREMGGVPPRPPRPHTERPWSLADHPEGRRPPCPNPKHSVGLILPRPHHHSRVYQTFILGPVPSYLYFREDYWITAWRGLPGCGWEPIGFRYYQYWQTPLVVYYDPAALVLRDLALATRRPPPPLPVGPNLPPPGINNPAVNNQHPAANNQVDNARAQEQAALNDLKALPASRLPGIARIRPSNVQQRQLAERFISFGDRHFAAGNYRRAYFQYKEAEKAAPDVAGVYFRQGFALIGNRQYELAYQAFRKGLALDPDWSKRDFPLRAMYGDREAGLRDDLANLAEACELSGNDSQLTFLLAVMLHAAGRPEDARPFFEKIRHSPVAQDVAGLFLPDEAEKAGEVAVQP